MTTYESRPGHDPGRPDVVARDTLSVTDTGDSYWSDGAAAAIRRLAASGVVFDAQDVREAVTGEPAHPAIPGTVFRAAHQAGLIVPVGWTNSRRRSVHGSAIRLWRGTRRAREGAV